MKIGITSYNIQFMDYIYNTSNSAIAYPLKFYIGMNHTIAI